MKKVYIAAARRTAIGSFNGTLAGTSPIDFAVPVVQELLNGTGLAPGAVDEVLMGNILPAGNMQGPARQVAIEAGIPNTVPAYTVNMVCGSGMKTVMNAATAIAAGLGNVYIAGGSENMSMAPYLVPGARQGLRMGDKQIWDHMLHDALTDAFGNYHMGVTAENVAAQYGLSREEQDAFAIRSQQKAIAAVDAGKFEAEIVPIAIKQRKAEVVFGTDEYPNRATTLEKLAALRPAFQKDGTVTAGNSSGINDGAAFLLVVSEEALKTHGLTPMAEIIGFGQGGVDPAYMGLGPVPAVRNALKAANLTLADIEVLELNEAFAAQALGVVKELSREHGVAEETLHGRTNLNGGAIALGHPVGASGARIVVTLAHLLQSGAGEVGLASLCIGGGMGTAVVLRKV